MTIGDLIEMLAVYGDQEEEVTVSIEGLTGFDQLRIVDVGDSPDSVVIFAAAPA